MGHSLCLGHRGVGVCAGGGGVKSAGGVGPAYRSRKGRADMVNTA